MKLYLVQENYWTIDPDNDNECYKDRNILGVYLDIKSAKEAIEKACVNNVYDNPRLNDFDIYEIDTDKNGEFLYGGLDITEIRVFD